MKVLVHGCFRTAFALLVATAVCSGPAYAAMDPQFELDPQTLESTAASRPERKKVRRPVRQQPEKARPRAVASSVYTVKPGDHIFKILMRDYGLSNDQAEALVGEICRENGIRDIRRLQVGQKLKIPAQGRDAVMSSKSSPSVDEGRQPQISGEESTAQAFHLDPTAPAATPVESALQLKNTWDTLVPSGPESDKPLAIQSPNFSLSLDSRRYPVFATLDGARIVVDQGGTIPPLVRSLITEKDPGIRIVSGSSDNRQFLADMLKSAGFYSVEEDFLLTFGKDPKISVVSDFKVERKPDSLVQQDVVLLNASRDPFPASLGNLLKKEGFTVHEPFAVRRAPASFGRGEIHRISGTNQTQIVDALLKALAVTGHSNRKVDVFATENNGISLSVSAERYFEKNGKKFVVTRFDGDPINYTLFRILETRGYQVVILEPQDSFRKISEKILSRLNLRGNFSQHSLWPAREENYSVQLSGFKVEGASRTGGSLFLTDVELDRVVRDILGEKGFLINENR